MKMSPEHIKGQLSATFAAILFVCMIAVPEFAFAQSGDFSGADGKACGFMKNITGILNIISLAVVTIAIVFAGYQIAFAHKRISDVAPILIGGVLIGAAGQIAKMMLGGNADASCTGSGSIFSAITTLIPMYA